VPEPRSDSHLLPQDPGGPPKQEWKFSE
jgi:hypothetical protein